ncbi:MAG: hypothetical protein JO104_10980 [Candidatus Eremiobacteraeota bacterium]|nr:hypothetical protein [Candidatus Eremiobacteraeota bacterium]
MMIRSKQLAGTLTACAAAAAIGVAAPSPARGAPQSNNASCIFHLAVNPIACARIVGSRPRPPSRSWLAASTGKTLLYAAEPFAGIISVSTVSANKLTPSGELSFSGAIPFELAADSKNLYVGLLNPSGPSSVEVFPRGATKPSKIYTDGITGPLDVAIDAHGTLYVANFVSSSSCNVLEYAKGSMKPTATITDVPGCPNGVAVDSASNLYVTYIYYPTGKPWQTDVLKYARGSTSGVRLNLKAPGRNDFYGLAVDAKGDVLVANEQEDGMLYQILIFPAGSHAPTNALQYGDGWFPLFFALDEDRLFAPAYLEQGTASLMTLGDVPAEFDYPSGRERIVESPKLLAPGFVFSFAVSP